MDPITAFGVATGAMQLVDFGAGSLLCFIKILKALKEAPERLKILLDDLEHFARFVEYLRPQLEDTNSALYGLLSASPGQPDALNSILGSADSAMLDLKCVLQSLIQNQTHQSLRAKAWRAIISLRNEKAILQKTHRLEKLKHEIIRELELCNIGTQVIQKELLLGLRSSVDQVQSDLRPVHLLLDRVSEMPYRLSELQSVMERESRLTRQALLSARDFLISRMTGRLTDTEPSALMRLHEDDKHDLARLVSKQFLQYPADLRDASKNLISVSQNFRTKRLSKYFDSNCLKCHCFPYQRMSVSTVGMFGLVFKSNSDHQPNCPFYLTNKRSWTYGLAVKLLPFLNKTVELMVSITSGSGGASIAPNLRFYGTVKRSESPMFRLFDEFYQSCAVIVYSGPKNMRFYELADDFIPFWDHSSFLIFDWDVQKAERFLILALERLDALFASDYTKAVDKDESGHSIFHEIVILAISLGPHRKRFTQYLENIMALASRYGADKSATARLEDRLIVPFYSNKGPSWSYRRYFNVAEVLTVALAESVEMANLHSIYLDSTTLYNSLTYFDLDKPQAPYRHFRKFSQKLLLLYHPDLAEDFPFDPLHIAIVHRCLDEVKLLLNQGHDPNGPLENESCCPLELALGWPSGMELLISAGANCFEALKLAIELEDVASVEMLMAGDCPIFHERDESTYDPLRPNDIVGLVAQQANETINAIFIRGLKDRRQRLANLALNHLSDEERGLLNMKDDRILDAAALDTYCLLVEKGVAIPKACYPGIIRTVYHFRLGYGFLVDVSFYDSLFSAGFRDLDEQTNDFDTPLLQHSTMLNTSDHELLYLISWFLQRGVNPNFCTKDSFPNILFYLGAHCHWVPALKDEELVLFIDLTERAAAICDPLITDKCNCYCSSNGCLPSNKFARCDAQGFYHDFCRRFHRPELDRLLEWWMQSTGLNDAQREVYYHEACQLEIFDRLGMAHTCCVNQKRPCEGRRIVIPEGERVQLQQEDAELLEQLGLIMHMYRECRSNFVGSQLKFWNWWWDYVSAILPDFLPHERCRFRCESQFRPAENLGDIAAWAHDHGLRIQEILTRNGYAGLDFADVIHQHFTKVLDTEHALEVPLADDGTANLGKSKNSSHESKSNVFEMESC